MYHIVETKKSFEQAAIDLEAAVIANGFGVLYVHDLGATLKSKGIAFENQCKVFEVCNPQQAAKVMTIDMRLNMALPCRISVYTDAGKTMISLILPVRILSALSLDEDLMEIAQEIQDATIKMIDEAK